MKRCCEKQASVDEPAAWAGLVPTKRPVPIITVSFRPRPPKHCEAKCSHTHEAQEGCLLARRLSAMATRSQTAVFLRYRDSMRSHKSGPRTNMELRDFKVHKNLLAAHSDDEGSIVDARVYSVPPMWVTLVDDMNRDISQIKIKSTRSAPEQKLFVCGFPLCDLVPMLLLCAPTLLSL